MQNACTVAVMADPANTTLARDLGRRVGAFNEEGLADPDLVVSRPGRSARIVLALPVWLERSQRMAIVVSSLALAVATVLLAALGKQPPSALLHLK